MRKALFLDRDGVINVEKGYVHKIEDFEFTDGIFDLVLHFQNRGYLIFVITNQAGIGRGYYTESDFFLLTEWMIHQFADNGITITKVYYCPTHPEYGIGEYKIDSYKRKPNPGMILEAAAEYRLDLLNSVLIGDKKSDIMAGINASIGTTILVSNKNSKDSMASYMTNSIQKILDNKKMCNGK